MHKSMMILYVKDVQASADFYTKILQVQPQETAEHYVALVHAGGYLGLWQRDTVLPEAQGGCGNTELALALESQSAVEDAHQFWLKQGWLVLQAPEKLPFAYTAVVADPDGHRVRVMA